MRSDRDIRELVRQSDATIDPRVDQAILADATARLQVLGQRRGLTSWPDAARRLMRSKWTRLAIAAGLILVAILGIYHMGGFVDGTGMAFAAVVQEIREFRPYRCRVLERGWD